MTTTRTMKETISFIPLGVAFLMICGGFSACGGEDKPQWGSRGGGEGSIAGATQTVISSPGSVDTTNPGFTNTGNLSANPGIQGSGTNSGVGNNGGVGSFEPAQGSAGVSTPIPGQGGTYTVQIDDVALTDWGIVYCKTVGDIRTGLLVLPGMGAGILAGGLAGVLKSLPGIGAARLLIANRVVVGSSITYATEFGCDLLLEIEVGGTVARTGEYTGGSAIPVRDPNIPGSLLDIPQHALVGREISVRVIDTDGIFGFDWDSNVGICRGTVPADLRSQVRLDCAPNPLEQEINIVTTAQVTLSFQQVSGP